MNLAVLLAKNTPNYDGLPPEWPVECKELGTSTTLPNDGRSWILMTCKQLSDRQSLYMADYQVWYGIDRSQDNP